MEPNNNDKNQPANISIYSEALSENSYEIYQKNNTLAESSVEKSTAIKEKYFLNTNPTEDERGPTPALRNKRKVNKIETPEADTPEKEEDLENNFEFNDRNDPLDNERIKEGCCTGKDKTCVVF